MDKILISNIISHGFLDFYNNYFDNNYDFLKYYLLIIFLNVIFMIIFPSFITLCFIITSMFHFGQDFVYITNFTHSSI